MNERIFGVPATLRVEFHDDTLHEADDGFWAVGRERGRLEMGDGEVPLDVAVRTTRLFRGRPSEQRWRQVHHHGSVEDPGLLGADRSCRKRRKRRERRPSYASSLARG